MSLFIQSLVALAASVSASPATVEAAPTEPAAIVAAPTQGDIAFAANLAAKLDSVTPRSEINRKPIWGETWPQTTWLEIGPIHPDAPEAAGISATEALRRIGD